MALRQSVLDCNPTIQCVRIFRRDKAIPITPVRNCVHSKWPHTSDSPAMWSVLLCLHLSLAEDWPLSALSDSGIFFCATRAAWKTVL